MNKQSRFLNPLLLSVLLVLTGFLTRKGTASVWEAVADDAPPPEEMAHSVRFREAATWAILSGAAVGLARVLVRRLLAKPGVPMRIGRPVDDVSPFV